MSSPTALKQPIHSSATNSWAGTFAAHADLYLLVILLVRAFWQFRILAASKTAEVTNFLDTSWQLDLLAKARHGFWLGRDVYFTYGPLAQWLWAHVRIDSGSLGSQINTLNFFPCVFTTAMLYACGWLLLGRSWGWKRALWLLLAVVWSPWDLKVSAALFAFAFAVSLQTSPAFSERNSAALPAASRGCLAALICALAFLISVDAGFYALAAVVISFAAFAFIARPLRQRFVFAAAFCLTFFLGMFAVNAWAGSALHFQFWKIAFAMVNAYRWTLPLGMVRPLRLALEAALLATLWFWYRGWKLAASRDEKAAWWAALLFSVLALQSAMVRSDWIHLAIGLFPAILLSTAVSLRSQIHGRFGWLQFAAPLLMVGLFAFLFPALQPTRSFWSATIYPATACAPPQLEFEGGCLSAENALRLQRAAAFIRADSSPQESIAIFPYENIYGVATARPVAGAILQSYIAASHELQQVQIQGYERAHPPLALISEDDSAAFAIDGVPNFTRNPEIWFYLQQHYAGKDVAPGLLAAQRDGRRAQHWRLSVQALFVAASVRIIPKQPAVIAENLESQAAFLRITVRVHYPIWWKISKPSHPELVLRFADGQQKNISVILPPDQWYELWAYTGPAGTMNGYFLPDPSQWPQPPSHRLQSIALEFNRSDWSSVYPTRLDVKKIEAATPVLLP